MSFLTDIYNAWKERKPKYKIITVTFENYFLHTVIGLTTFRSESEHTSTT